MPLCVETPMARVAPRQLPAGHVGAGKLLASGSLGFRVWDLQVGAWDINLGLRVWRFRGFRVIG